MAKRAVGCCGFGVRVRGAGAFVSEVERDFAVGLGVSKFGQGRVDARCSSTVARQVSSWRSMVDAGSTFVGAVVRARRAGKRAASPLSPRMP